MDIFFFLSFRAGREYTLCLSANLNGLLWCHNKRKVDAELPAAREEQNWYSMVIKAAKSALIDKK